MTIDPVSLAITVALNAASMAMNMMKKIEGPRLTDLSVTVADYGTPYNYLYGTRKVEVPCVFAEEIKEKKKKRKTKGGKYKEYTYFGTWACVIADMEIGGVTRIWFDKHLVLDRTGSGVDSVFSLKDGYELASAIRIYLGTEDQLPDPRMEATIEAAEGEGTCPALRGRAYIFFEDIPLEKLGNRMPQVTVEAVGLAEPSYPQSIAAGLLGIARPVFSADRGYMLIYAGSGTFEVWDLITRTRLRTGALDLNGIFGGSVAISPIGTIWSVGGSILSSTDPGSFATTAIGATFAEASIVHAFVDQFGHEVIVVMSVNILANGVHVYLPPGLGGMQPINWDAVADGALPSCACVNAYGEVWAAGGFLNGASTIRMVRCFPGIGDQVASLAMPTGSGTPFLSMVHNAAESHYVISDGGTMYFFDDFTFALKFTANQPGAIDFINYGPDDDTAWAVDITPNTFSEISLRTGATLRTIEEDGNWTAPALYRGVYDRVNHAIVGNHQDGEDLIWRYLDRQAQTGTTLRAIVEDVAARVGLAPADIDADDLTDDVSGYSWTQGGARDIIEPLLELYDIDSRPHDFRIEFIRRGGASGGIVETEWLVREDENDARYVLTIANDTDLPHRIFLNFADVDHDQQTNSAVARRSPDSVDSVRELTLDLTTWAADKDQAQRFVERILRRRWFARQSIDLKLTAKELALEPADIRTLDLDGSFITARLVRNRIGANGVLAQNWERDDPALSGLSTSEGPGMFGRAPSVLLLPVSTRGFLIDSPLWIDAHDQATPFVYLVAGPWAQAGFWPGADVMTSSSGAAGDYAGGWDSVEPPDAMTWGLCDSALGDSPADLLDEGAFSLRLIYGAIETVTEAELLDDQAVNLAAVGTPEAGFELIQFRTATLEGDGSYTISGLIRGARGTEWAIGTHAIGDAFVLLASAAKRHPMGISEVGVSRFYNPVTHERGEGSGTAFQLEFAGATRKPLAPAHVLLAKDAGSGDWEISWQRRTRLGGANIDGGDVPLGETAEAYKVRILDGDEVVRTIETADESATYEDADQTADFGSSQGSLSIKVCQVAPDLALDGFETAATA